MSTIMELMLAVRKRRIIFYHKDTNQFDYNPITEKELENISFDERISNVDKNNIPLPSYEEIGHKDIMRFFCERVCGR